MGFREAMDEPKIRVLSDDIVGVTVDELCFIHSLSQHLEIHFLSLIKYYANGVDVKE